MLTARATRRLSRTFSDGTLERAGFTNLSSENTLPVLRKTARVWQKKSYAPIGFPCAPLRLRTLNNPNRLFVNLHSTLGMGENFLVYILVI